MTLKEQITEDMKSAMRAKEAERLGTIRLLLAAIKQREVDERITVDDAGIIAIIEKLNNALIHGAHSSILYLRFAQSGRYCRCRWKARQTQKGRR
ncbi:MAG: hypothetical protein EB139_02700 [Burkholderiaceae bacterium]|nr:hypothetical protein [Burkholderiaceae bacterium]